MDVQLDEKLKRDLSLHRFSVSIYKRWIVQEHLEMLKKDYPNLSFSTVLEKKKAIISLMSTNYIWDILKGDLNSLEISFEVI